MTLFVPKTKSSFKRSNDCINSCHRNHHLTLPKNLQFPLVLTKRGRQQWLRDKIHCRQCHLVWSFYFWSYSIFRYDRRSTPIKFWSDDCSRKWCRPSLGHHLLLNNRRRRFSWRKSNTPAWDMSKKELRSTWFGRYFDWDHDEVIYWSKQVVVSDEEMVLSSGCSSGDQAPLAEVLESPDPVDGDDLDLQALELSELQEEFGDLFTGWADAE